jgi:UDP-glucuronate 4-epimerase
MHVVVTGAAGFIGSHTTERLVRAGHRVTGIDAFETAPYPAEAKRRNVVQLSKLAPHQFRMVSANICDPAAMAAAIDPSVDVICHLAALAGVRPSLAEPLRYIDTNIRGTGVIIERMRELGLTRLVFASSSSVYGAKPGADVAAFAENEPCLTPASPYAATKRMNELQLSTYRDLYGIGVFALRFFTVYGPRQRTDMAISKFIDAIANGRAVALFGDGSSRRDYTFIDDIVSGVVAAIERVEPKRFEIINLGGSRTISLSELIDVIERTVGKSAVRDWQPDQPGDVPITYANIDCARALLGYEPTTRIEDGIVQQWNWVRTGT